MSPSFVHLHVHSDYSIEDSIARVPDLVRRCAELEMPAIALTDLNNLFGLVKFYKAATARGIKPIIGCEVLLAPRDAGRPPGHLLLLVQNDTGYRNLTRLVSRTWLDNRRADQPCIERAWLAEHAEGLIALSGGVDGEIGATLLDQRAGEARALLAEMQALFPGRFYLELSRCGQSREEDHVYEAMCLAAEHACPVVATNRVRFFTPDDFEAHEARVCIRQGRVLNDPSRPRDYSEQQYLRSPQEMAELFSDIPEALANSVEIARRCTLALTLGENFLPQFPIPEGMTEESFFRAECEAGLERRFAMHFDMGGDDFQTTREQYYERLEFELNTIIQMKFPGYFLIVADFIRWAKENGIPVGPGRGSGAGSIVAWALGITDLDPIEYDLLFERFLNPERVSMPDFDVDFCPEGRDRVIQYVADTYGRECVSQIITYGTLGAKAALRDVARVQGKPRGLADRMAKCIPNIPPGITLNDALEQFENLREILDEEEDAQEIWDMALKLEGLTRQVGKHAGGVVIAPSQLTDFVPLYAERGEGVVTQFDKDDVESVGLVKFDFLGLRNLTVIDHAVRDINAAGEVEGMPGGHLDVLKIPLDDAPTYELLRKARTTAVFQLESGGMRRLMKDLGPTCFEDIVALVALFRPGPLETGMADDFVQRKNGKQAVVYPHPDLEPVLSTTYGTILYQEQVMQIAQVLARYSLGGADMLRRAMGKKKAEIMDQERGKFIKGSVDNGVDEALANSIFDQMQEFAKYCFNKSHSAAYAMVAYQTAWLKVHYPAYFMAADLSSEMHDKDRLVVLVEDCRQFGLKIVPPCANRSAFRFIASANDEIVYGLGAIDGVGHGPVGQIVAERERGGAYTDLPDLVRRCGQQALNKKVLESLIRAGALDFSGEHRAWLMSSLPETLRMAEQEAQRAGAGMGDLFGDASQEAVQSVRAMTGAVAPWSQRRQLKEEKAALGLFLSGHLIDSYRAELTEMGTRSIASVQPAKSRQLVVGILHDLIVRRNKNGERWAILKLEDRSGRIEATLFAREFDTFESRLQVDQLLFVRGTVRVDNYSGRSMRGDSVQTISEARSQYARRILLDLAGLEMPVEQVRVRLRELLETSPGRFPLELRCRSRQATAEFRLGSAWCVEPGDDLLEGLGAAFGSARVQVDYSEAEPDSQPRSVYAQAQPEPA